MKKSKEANLYVHPTVDDAPDDDAMPIKTTYGSSRKYALDYCKEHLLDFDIPE